MSDLRVAAPPAERPLLIFDGDCAFCRLWVERWRAATGPLVDYAPFQEAGARFPEIPAEIFARSVVLIDTAGRVRTGALAALSALAARPSLRWPLWLCRNVPGLAPTAEICYAFIASRRTLFSRLTRLGWGPSALRPSYAVSRCVLLRLVALIYLGAFVSLWTQVDGLIGSRGILPIAARIHAAGQQIGLERFWMAPTLSWLDPGDGFLRAQCGAGAALAALAALGLAPAVCFSLMWALYLSLATAGGTFLAFQWDSLLLETGFLAILMAPLRPRCRIGCERSPSRIPLALARWLVFRLMFCSGVAKLSSGDPAWRDLTALTFHYETQCLPPWTAWYAHHLPVWFQKISCLSMFAIELGAPFLIFAPRRLRHLAAGAMIALQAIILATGNYGFFNLLSIALCLTLIDDTLWPARWRTRAAAGAGARRWPLWTTAPLAGVILLVGSVHLVDAFRADIRWPAPVGAVVRAVSPLRSVNGYGLFSVMTRSRDEIVLEGSDDGVTWRAYEFRWKPGDVGARPAFFTPHMPRLDWQMWFAALESYRAAHWMEPLMGRLLEGSPSALALLGRNPFPSAPPRYVRALLYAYHFTDAAERRATGAWWKRTLRGAWSPTLSRRGG